MGEDSSNNKDKIIEIGDTVTLKLHNGEEKAYTIKTSTETDPENGVISNECPIGQAILGRVTGDLVSYQVGDNAFSAHIVRVD